MACNYKGMFWCFYVNQKVFLLFTNSDLLVHSDHKPLLKIFTGNTDNEKCNTWSLEATTILRHVKVQHIKGIANIFADSVKTQSSRPLPQP